MADRREVINLKKNLYKTGPTVSGYLEAAAICTPSYLSFDYALSCHGLIPERAKIYLIDYQAQLMAYHAQIAP
ncbi:hypothetical protein, partial [Faecalibaculum rodentium]|uniref:hypothetical protein n=1 Tax=Faecalibaculum rodentium TaxID=1702221 RepID=UPI00273116DA